MGKKIDDYYELDALSKFRALVRNDIYYPCLSDEKSTKLFNSIMVNINHWIEDRKND